MKLDARLDAAPLTTIQETAQRAERAGYGALWTSETAHDPFLPLVVAAEHTQEITLGCAVAVALARNPMTVASVAHDLQGYAAGRFVLGLGTQVRSHVERRFSMPWSDPASRMGEFVTAVCAIWAAWADGTELDFEGAYYRHTLMTPMFRPEPHGYRRPPILIGAVGTQMIETAARVADGMFVHAFTTPEYLREVVVPTIAANRPGGGDDFAICCRGFVATGVDDRAVEHARESIRRTLAFYGSTPAYRPVLGHHGWEDLADELHRMSRTGRADRWTVMAGLVGDEVLEAFAVTGTPDRVGREIARRYGPMADRFWCYTPYDVEPDLLDEIAQTLSRLAGLQPVQRSKSAAIP